MNTFLLVFYALITLTLLEFADGSLQINQCNCLKLFLVLHPTVKLACLFKFLHIKFPHQADLGQSGNSSVFYTHLVFASCLKKAVFLFCHRYLDNEKKLEIKLKKVYDYIFVSVITKTSTLDNGASL